MCYINKLALPILTPIVGVFIIIIIIIFTSVIFEGGGTTIQPGLGHPFGQQQSYIGLFII